MLVRKPHSMYKCLRLRSTPNLSFLLNMHSGRQVMAQVVGLCYHTGGEPDGVLPSSVPFHARLPQPCCRDSEGESEDGSSVFKINQINIV